MKRTIAIILAMLTIAALLTGCGSSEPVTAVHMALRVGCTPCSGGDSRHQLMCSDPQACGETKPKQGRMAEDRGFLFEQDRARTYVEKPWRCY